MGHYFYGAQHEQMLRKTGDVCPWLPLASFISAFMESNVPS